MLEPRHAVDERDKVLPTLLLCAQRLSPSRREAVVAASTLLSLLDPPPNNPSVRLESVEQRIERGHMKSQRAARSELNQLRNVVPVPGLILQQRENEELSAAFLPFRVGPARKAYCSVPYIEPHNIRRSADATSSVVRAVRRKNRAEAASPTNLRTAAFQDGSGTHAHDSMGARARPAGMLYAVAFIAFADVGGFSSLLRG